MLHKVSLITPTGGRPEALGLCKKWIDHQTVQPDEWVIINDDEQDIPKSPDGLLSQGRNLARALDKCNGSIIFIIEDDDYYSPTYIEKMLEEFEENNLDLLGEATSRYYNIRERKWREFNYPTGQKSALCQTVMSRRVADVLRALTEHNIYPFDYCLWAAISKSRLNCKSVSSKNVIGIKGMPGRAGIGIGHRPQSQPNAWHLDADLSKFKIWLGKDYEYYLPYLKDLN